MKSFNYFQPTEIIFGAGRVAELADIVKRFGNRPLLVTTPAVPVMSRLRESLASHCGQSLRGSSFMLCTASNVTSHSLHWYVYVAIVILQINLIY